MIDRLLKTAIKMEMPKIIRVLPNLKQVKITYQIFFGLQKIILSPGIVQTNSEF